MRGILEVEGIDCFYGRSQVLWGVDLLLHSEETISVIGSNGAGKTTLLRAVCGLHKVSKGSIRWKGEPIENRPTDRIVSRGISQIPEGGGIFPYMSVLENLSVGAYARSNWDHRASNTAKVFSMFPRLEERKHQLAGTLSGGERQMLGIAKGLMASPECLILDEPSLGLSPKLVLLLLDSVEAIAKQGVSVLLVEQNVHLAMKVSNRAYVLENGKMVKEGESGSLLSDDHVRKAYLGL
jgi:branched-chain amino acid transport system ATP-binding protein